MLDIEAKNKLKASDGVNIFFTIIFLVITGNCFKMRHLLTKILKGLI